MYFIKKKHRKSNILKWYLSKNKNLDVRYLNTQEFCDAYVVKTPTFYVDLN